jgi:hypothetical protein
MHILGEDLDFNVMPMNKSIYSEMCELVFTPNPLVQSRISEKTRTRLRNIHRHARRVGIDLQTVHRATINPLHNILRFSNQISLLKKTILMRSSAAFILAVIIRIFLLAATTDSNAASLDRIDQIFMVTGLIVGMFHLLYTLKAIPDSWASKDDFLIWLEQMTLDNQCYLAFSQNHSILSDTRTRLLTLKKNERSTGHCHSEERRLTLQHMALSLSMSDDFVLQHYQTFLPLSELVFFSVMAISLCSCPMVNLFAALTAAN